jgi:hypothetical protein
MRIMFLSEICRTVVGLFSGELTSFKRRVSLIVFSMDIFSNVRSRIAFSQPTQSGRKLAVKWFGREDFLVFKE